MKKNHVSISAIAATLFAVGACLTLALAVDSANVDSHGPSTSSGFEYSLLPEPTPSPIGESISTIEQYEQALAKWHSQGIVEYEITVTVLSLIDDEWLALRVT